MLELRRLRLLRELHVRGTITAVAEALSYSPSTVSEQLAELEREAAVALFERAGRNLRLTEAGRVLAEHAEALLLSVERAHAEVAAAAKAVNGVVRVATFQSAAIELLPPTLRRLATEHPGLRVEVCEMETEPALQALALHEIDLLVAVEYDHLPRPRDGKLVREDLLREPMRLVVPSDHPVARSADPVAIAALSDAAWAAGHPGSGHAAMVAYACNALGGFDPRIRHRADDQLILLALVRSGAAVTLLPELVVEGLTTGVCVRDVAEAQLTRLIFLAARAPSLERPALQAVRAILADVCHARVGSR
jgi:DNA-binding transcriptional LysR family regulator